MWESCWLLLFNAIATVFQLCLGSVRMNEMRRRNPEPTLYRLKGSLISHTIYAYKLAFDDTVSYTQG